MTTPAFDGFFLLPQAARLVGDPCEGFFEVVLDNGGARRGPALRPWQDGAAIRAGERLFRGVPFRIPAAFRAG
ncbi:MAG: hypothetical protein MUC40_09875, partial [Akkermansiaceae bacterium]|nr:hypothetical protein [Akkermansiaceae bacterium]